MIGKGIYRLLWIGGIGLLLVLIMGINLKGAHAQDGSTLQIQSLQSDAFPTMQFAFVVYDGEGNFKTDIQLSDVKVIENGSERALTKLELNEPGLQTLFAINASPELSALTGGGSYFEQIKNGMLSWAQGRAPNDLDDTSLIDNTGLKVIRTTDIRQWEQAVAEYSPDLLASRQSLAALNIALDLALESNPHPNMKRSILYVSPPPLAEHGQALPNLADRAVQQGVEVNVWLVPAANVSFPEGVEMLRNMAQATGGTFVQISAQEELQDIENNFQQLRYIYQGEYLSEITRSGNQSISLKIDTRDYQSASPAYPFRLDISPPNPIFFSPPSQVVRSWSDREDGSAGALEPEREPIQILVEFQDGYPRDLLKTTLYVNGEKAAENLSPPFDRFEWDLQSIMETGSFQLQVEAVDILGLSQRSITLPVDVVVEVKELTLLERITSEGVLPIVIAISFAGVIVLSVLSLVRGKPWEPRNRKVHKRSYQAPGVQEQKTGQETDRKISTMQNQTWPSSGGSFDAPARLVAIDGDGVLLKEQFILLNRKEITFGSDPKQATHVLRSNTVSGLHARMTQSSGDAFVLADAGSIAGTWVNLAPVSSSGRIMRHGDLVHIGCYAFIFELRKPHAGSGIKVYPLDKGDIW